MMVNLITFSRKGARKDFALGSTPLIIGRKPEADIRIPLGEVSRAHCEVRVQGGKILVRDLGSSNGTYVNDQKVTEAALKAGDQMRVGPVQFTVQVDGKPERISPPPAPAAPASAASKPAAASTEATTRIPPAPAKPAADDDFDIDNLEELDSEDLSDFDIDEISDSGVIEDIEEVGDAEEIDNLEEISEDDLIPDDDSGKV